MNLSFVILCVAAFALVALLISAFVHVAMPWLDRLASRIGPALQVRFWLGLAVIPLLIGGLTIGLSLLHTLGIGSDDHCLGHGFDHLHLCAHHLKETPGRLLVLVAVLFVLRSAYILLEIIKNLRLSITTCNSLAEVSDRYKDAFVFSSDKPEVFVLGVLRPRVHLSRGFLKLGPEVVDPVLAHERAHVKRQDVLWRVLFPFISIGHFPWVSKALRARFITAQEVTADTEAAKVFENGNIHLAEALLRFTQRSAPTSPDTASNVIQTPQDLKVRIHTLLEEKQSLPTWPAPLLLLCAFIIPIAMSASHDFIHHGLEILLNILN